MPHPLIYTAPYRLGPLLDDELFRRLCRSRDYLAAGFDQPLRLADAAREACLSPYHYHRLFTHTFGETPHEFLTRLRIDRGEAAAGCAIRLPVTESVSRWATRASVRSASRFARWSGIRPSEYQRAIRRSFAVPGLADYRFCPRIVIFSISASGRF